MQTKNKNCTSLNYFNWYKQTQKPHPNRKTFNHINGNLYHYAGNNPVRYIDPDGNESFCPLFGFSNPIGELFNFIAQNSSGSDKLVASTLAVSNGNAESAYRLEKLSPYMCEAMSKASGEAVIGGMRVMADHGSEVSLVCYATGNVEMGLVIDGISTACDVTLAIHDYLGSDRTKKDTAKLIIDLSTTVTSNVVVGPTVTNSVNKAGRLGQEEFTEKLANILSNIISSEFDSTFDSFLNNRNEQ